MRKLTGPVVVLLLAAATAAHAGPPFGCCVCEQSGAARPLFCAAIASGEISDFYASCMAQGGTGSCTGASNPDACDARFESAGCAAPVGAPVAGPGGVLAVAALLAGFGVWALRLRHARRGNP